MMDGETTFREWHTPVNYATDTYIHQHYLVVYWIHTYFSFHSWSFLDPLEMTHVFLPCTTTEWYEV
jgi:hypothetical protein